MPHACQPMCTVWRYMLDMALAMEILEVFAAVTLSAFAAQKGPRGYVEKYRILG